jgi:enamine deaminase RidA (YjgF/YER057c/UK114 family)
LRGQADFYVETSFDALSLVMNRASDLMVAAFAERGRHARTAVGVSYLPFNALVGIEAPFEIGA